MKEWVYNFNKNNGRVFFGKKLDLKLLIDSLEDGNYEYIVRKKKKKRSNNQN